MMERIIELEKEGWQALSSEEEAGKQYYSTVLHEKAMMLFPGGMQIEGKDNILKSISAQPWKSFEIENPQVVSVSETVKILAYHVTAKREGSEPYNALISSTYVLEDDKWKLIFHQHTPK